MGFAFSLRESSTAFLKAAVWATMVKFVVIFIFGGRDDRLLVVGEACVWVEG